MRKACPSKTNQSGLTSLIESPKVASAGVASQLGGLICPITNRQTEGERLVKYRPIAVALASIVAFLCLEGAAWAQTGASLSGAVTNQTGVALSDVAVTIKNVDTGITRTVATDRDGHFQASGLTPGRFEIRAAK